ncbi:enterochelin esterase domain-containing protein, partial [Nocardioides dubius]
MIRRTPPKVPRPDPVARVTHPDLAALTGDVDGARAYWEQAQGRLPLLAPQDDGRVRVTFCWWDPDAVRVLLFVNRITDETRLAESLLEQVPGTPLWHASYLMDPDWRASYCFLAERPGQDSPLPATTDQIRIRELLDHGEPDPGNPDRTRNRAGVAQSVVSLPSAPAQRWHTRRDDVAAGTVRRDEVDGRRVWWYAPAPGLARVSARVSDRPASGPTPLVVALDGEVWTSSHSLPTILDNLIADGLLPPVHAVLVDSGGRDQRWQEL